MLELTIKANNYGELASQLLELASNINGITFQVDTLVKTPEPETKPEEVEPVKEEPVKEEIKPVITQAQMEENIKNMPVPPEPKKVSLEEVRAALKTLRDKKGTEKVKELLSAYGAESLPQLKPEDYDSALARAQMEV